MNCHAIYPYQFYNGEQYLKFEIKFAANVKNREKIVIENCFRTLNSSVSSRLTQQSFVILYLIDAFTLHCTFHRTLRWSEMKTVHRTHRKNNIGLHSTSWWRYISGCCHAEHSERIRLPLTGVVDRIKDRTLKLASHTRNHA